MKRECLTIICLLFVICSINVVDTFGQDYTVLPYAQYTSVTSSGRLVMDDASNLYVAHYDDGKILKINPSGQSTVFASGLGNLYDITWGGGTAFGNYLYATSRTPNFMNDKILKIDLTGNSSSFASMTSPRHAPSFIEIDRTGNYGGNMFSSGTGQDQVYTILPSANVLLFANWPNHVSGGIYGAGFDITGKYNNNLYLCTIVDDANLSGLFIMNPNGTVSRFADDLVSALNVDFDPVGTYFDNDMFVLGAANFNDPMSLWRVYADGSCDEFMKNVSAFTFGNDGALYVSHYNWNTQEVSISRVIPEPATLALLAVGGVCLRRRKV